jgi:type I restriction enzyme M protein
MAKGNSAAKAADMRGDVLLKAEQELGSKLGYTEVRRAEVGGETCAVATVGGKPVVLLYVPQADGPITQAVSDLAVELGASVQGGPADYVWATTTGELGNGYMYSWVPGKESQVSFIPAYSDWIKESDVSAPKARPKADPARTKQLQGEFDDLHERIYAAREPVNGKNDLIEQLCKCIFLKMHSERHPDFRIPTSNRLLSEVFRPDYIRANKDQAVQQIKEAFKVAKSLPEYCLKDDRGRDFQIFDADDFIKFNQPETFALMADMLNRHHLTNPDETGLEDDVVGRAFDVILRAKFESKGGMGIYLTPQQVRDAMVQMAFHDILKEDQSVITRRDLKTGVTSFRVCDPSCGSGGFLVTAMREVRKHVSKLVGLSAQQQHDLLSDIYAQGFEGADNAHGMVLMARINMALHGDPKARVFSVRNSLTADVFVPETFDLILSNPPFKKGGITQDGDADILRTSQTDIVDGAPQMSGDGLALGAKPDGKGVWKPVKSVDPAVLFIDRCLQLLKPGGRLLIVVPDGILCNSSDRYVREYLIGRKDETTGRFVGGKAILRAVVSLPPVTFRLSGAGAKTSFLYLQKKRPGDEQGPVFMAVANDVGFDVKQNKEVLTTNTHDLIKIVEAYKQGPGEATPQGES